MPPGPRGFPQPTIKLAADKGLPARTALRNWRRLGGPATIRIVAGAARDAGSRPHFLWRATTPVLPPVDTRRENQPMGVIMCRILCRPSGLGRLAAAMVLIAVATPSLHAEVPAPENSLAWIPQDAAFYQAVLRNREQLDAVVHSRAWARLRALPLWREVERLGSSPAARLAWQEVHSRAVASQPAAGQIESLVERSPDPAGAGTARRHALRRGFRLRR